MSVYFSVVNTSCIIDPILLLRRFGIDDNNIARGPTIPVNFIAQDGVNSPNYSNISDNLLWLYSFLFQDNSKKKKDRVSRILVVVSIFISANYEDMSENSDNNNNNSTTAGAKCAIFQDWLDELSKEMCSL